MNGSGHTVSDQETREVSGPLPAIAEGALGPGDKVGRFMVLDTVGAGGMGRVYRAYDPTLSRELALKMVRPEAGGGSRGEIAARFLREARAMARLSHPNVLPVYDVEEHDGALCIAMEYVQGETLWDWLKEDRSTAEILRVFAEAGEGLAAAHRAGLVHRDFKPSNVLVGPEQRVRVMDFGLARGTHSLGDSVPSVAPVSASHDELAEPLTEADAIVGTPLYMAPEQLRRAEADPRSDQYAFCVALFRAVFGKRPFDATTFDEMRRQKNAGEIVDPGSGSVPPSIRRAILRGLRPDPDERWPSMEQLLVELRRDPRRARRLLVSGIGVVAMLGVAAFAGRQSGSDAAACETDRLREVWNPQRASELTAAFEATGLPYASEVATRVTASLDAYGRQWNEAFVSACEATVVEHSQSEELLDLRMVCLSSRLRDMGGVVESLADPDEGVVERAIQTAAALPGLEPCADAEFVRASIEPPPPELAQRVDQLRSRLAYVRATETTGQFREGLEAGEEALGEAEEVGYPPLLAEALIRVARLHDLTGNYPEAEEDLERAYFLAMHSGHDVVVEHALNNLVHVVGYRQARYEEGLDWARHSRAFIARRHPPGTSAAERELLNTLGYLYFAKGEYGKAQEVLEQALEMAGRGLDVDPATIASTHNNMGNALLEQGKIEEAIGHYQQAIELWEAKLGSDHPHLALALNGLASAYQASGQDEQALEIHRRVLGLLERAVGPRHPWIATTCLNTGNALMVLGRPEDAVPYYERALSLWNESVGPEHPYIALGRGALGNVLFELGRNEDAKRELQAALDLQERTVGPDHLDVAYTLTTLGILTQSEGDLDGAMEHFQRAARIYETAGGPEHPDLAEALRNTGGIHELRGDFAKAHDDFERGLRIREAAFGTEDPSLAPFLLRTGIAEVELGRLDEASVVLQRYLELAARHPVPDEKLADARFNLARALWTKPSGRARARELAMQARNGLAKFPEARATVDAWIAKHGSARG